MDLDYFFHVWVDINIKNNVKYSMEKKKASRKTLNKKTKKTKKRTKRIKRTKKNYKKISNDMLMLILLRKELSKRFCKCVKKIKYGKKKMKKGVEYPICYKSVFINRGIKPPKNVIKTCKKKRNKK